MHILSPQVRSGTFLVSRELMQKLKKSSPMLFLVRLANVLLLYFTFMFIGLYAQNMLVWIPIWFLQSVILIGFTAAIHESTHGNLSNSKRFNYIVGVILSTIIFKNFTSHKEFHLTHHKYTSLEGDPEPQFRFDTVWDYIMEFFSWPSMYFATCRTITNSLRERFPSYVKGVFVKKCIKFEAVIQIVWFLSLIVLGYFFADKLFKAYLIPAMLMGPMGFLFMIPEHHKTGFSDNPVLSTRTIKSNPIIRFLYWNNNYHTEHHAFPYVPFHNLPYLHQELLPQISHFESSYIGYHANLIRHLSWGLQYSKTRGHNKTYS